MADPNDVFSFMSNNGVGTKLSLFWIAWAFIAEKADNFQGADRIYNAGFQSNAEPRALLSQRYQQFQRRVTRKYLSAMDDEYGLAAPPATVKAPLIPESSKLSKISQPTSNAPAFDIFVESTDAVESSAPKFPKKNRSFLENEAQRVKENQGEIKHFYDFSFLLYSYT